MKAHTLYLRFLLAVLIGTFAHALHAQSADSPSGLGSVRVGSAAGKLILFNPDTEVSTEAAAGEVFTAPMTVIADGETVLQLSNGAVVVLQPGSRVHIALFNQAPFDESLGAFDSLAADPSPSQVILRIISGEVVARVGNLNPASSFVVQTPTGIVNANGVEMLASYDEQSHTTVVANLGGEGSLEHQSAGGQSTPVPAGQTVSVSGQADASGNIVAAEPVLTPTSAQTLARANSARQSAAAASAGTASGQPSSAPSGLPVTPEMDIADLINPTSTGPSGA